MIRTKRRGRGEVRGNEEKGEERRLRKVAGRGEIQRKETKGNRVNNLKRRRNINCCLLALQGTMLLLSSRLDSAMERCSSEVPISLQWSDW